MPLRLLHHNNGPFPPIREREGGGGRGGPGKNLESPTGDWWCFFFLLVGSSTKEALAEAQVDMWKEFSFLFF